MAEGNGHTHDLPRSVNIHKKGRVDADTLQEVLNDIKDSLVQQSIDIRYMKEKQTDMQLKLQPVVSFHKKVLTIAAFMAVPFTMFMGWIGAYIKAKFFN